MKPIDPNNPNDIRIKKVPFKCPNCNGWGTVRYEKIKCHSCEGKGFIIIDQEKGEIV